MEGPNENNIIQQSPLNGNHVGQPNRQNKNSRFAPQHVVIADHGRQDNATIGGVPPIVDQCGDNLTSDHSNEMQNPSEHFYQGHITQVSPADPTTEHHQVIQVLPVP